MKKLFYSAALTLIVTICLTACNSNGFKKTENGLLYRFDVSNTDGETLKPGDWLVGELTVKLDTTKLGDNVGHPDRLFPVTESCMFKGDIQEGLLMMHKGDKAVFGMPADSLAKFGVRMPKEFTQGKGQILYYEINLTEIITKEEMEREQANYYENMAQAKESEDSIRAQYIADNHITAKPTADGLYVIVNKKGKGPKVEDGKTVAIDYTGRLLDGTIFDSSREADARAAGNHVEGRTYQPLTYKVGEQHLIPGWEKGVMGQPEGTELTLIIPSSLAYGPGDGRVIPPFSTLRFDITIVSVN